MVKDEGEVDDVLGSYQHDILQSASYQLAENQVTYGLTTQEDHVEIIDSVFNEQDDIEVEVQEEIGEMFDGDDEVQDEVGDDYMQEEKVEIVNDKYKEHYLGK